MKSKTRDNLIYLSVGLGIVALLVADIIYSDAHGRPMWMPSRFALDVITGLGLLEYFVILEMRRTKAKPFEAFAAVISAALVHFVIFFAFRREIGELKGFRFSAIDVIEIFLVFQLSVQVAQATAKLSNRSRRTGFRL